MTERQPNKDLSETESYFDNDVRSGEGSHVLAVYDSFQKATHVIFEHVKHMMAGGSGASSDENKDYLQLLLNDATQKYMDTVSAADTYSEVITIAAEFLHGSVRELNIFIDSFELPVEPPTSTVADHIEVFKMTTDQDTDKEALAQELKQAFESIYSDCIQDLLYYADANPDDARQAKREALKHYAFDFAKDTTKIALGATAAILLSGLIRKKK